MIQVEKQVVEKSLDLDTNVRAALQILKAKGLDTSGYRKARKEAIRLGVENAEIDVNQKRLLRELHPTRRQHQELTTFLRPYRAAHLPAPADRERELYSLEVMLNQLEEDFEAGGVLLRESSEKRQKAQFQARHALVGTLATYCRGLGERVKDIIEPDAGFFMVNSHRVPSEALDLQREAVRINEIAGHLDTRIDHPYQAFVDGVGKSVMEVVEDVFHSRRFDGGIQRNPPNLSVQLDREIGGAVS